MKRSTGWTDDSAGDKVLMTRHPLPVFASLWFCGSLLIGLTMAARAETDVTALNPGLWSGGAGLGFMANTPDGVAEFGIKGHADYFVMHRFSSADWLNMPAWATIFYSGCRPRRNTGGIFQEPSIWPSSCSKEVSGLSGPASRMPTAGPPTPRLVLDSTRRRARLCRDSTTGDHGRFPAQLHVAR